MIFRVATIPSARNLKLWCSGDEHRLTPRRLRTVAPIFPAHFQVDLAKCDLFVLDGDRHGGPDGRAALRDLLRQQGFDGRCTPTTLTLNDGAHVVFIKTAMNSEMGVVLAARPRDTGHRRDAALLRRASR